MRPWVARLITAAIAGVAYPHAELAWKCRDGLTNSEACVWGRAYFPLTRWIEPILIAPIVFGAFKAAAFVISRRKNHLDRD